MLGKQQLTYAATDPEPQEGKGEERLVWAEASGFPRMGYYSRANKGGE